MLTYVSRNNKGSLVNMLVTFCSKLEWSFLTATMLLLHLHFSTTAKVPRPETWQMTKVIINKFFDQRIRKATKSLRRFGLVRFLTFLSIFVSLGLQTTHLSYDKNDVTSFCNVILLLYFSVSEPIPNLRYHSPLPLSRTNLI